MATTRDGQDVMALMPSDTPAYMADAWLSALLWASGHDGAMAQFRHDTGNQWKPGRAPIERMVDQATGAEWEFVKAFTLWFNEHVWGDINGPIDAEGE